MNVVTHCSVDFITLTRKHVVCVHYKSSESGTFIIYII